MRLVHRHCYTRGGRGYFAFIAVQSLQAYHRIKTQEKLPLESISETFKVQMKTLHLRSIIFPTKISNYLITKVGACYM